MSRHPYRALLAAVCVGLTACTPPQFTPTLGASQAPPVETPATGSPLPAASASEPAPSPGSSPSASAAPSSSPSTLPSTPASVAPEDSGLHNGVDDDAPEFQLPEDAYGGPPASQVQAALMVGTRIAARMLSFYESRHMETSNTYRIRSIDPILMNPSIIKVGESTEIVDNVRTTNVTIAQHLLTKQTGHETVRETLDGNLMPTLIEWNYEPDDDAKAVGLPGETWTFEPRENLEGGTFEYNVTGTSGAESQHAVTDSELKWNSATINLTLRDFADESVQVTGDVVTDTGLQFAVLGGRGKTELGEFRVMCLKDGNTEFVLVYPHVTDLTTARGFVFNHDPEAGEAVLYAHAYNRPNLPVKMQLMVPALPVDWDFLQSDESAMPPIAQGATTMQAAGRMPLGKGLEAAEFQLVQQERRRSGVNVLTGSARIDNRPVSFRAWDRPFMSDKPDLVQIGSVVERTPYRVALSQEGEQMTVSRGEAQVSLRKFPDGSFEVGGVPAVNEVMAAELLAVHPLVRAMPDDTLDGLILATWSLPDVQTRAPSPCDLHAWGRPRRCSSDIAIEVRDFRARLRGRYVKWDPDIRAPYYYQFIAQMGGRYADWTCDKSRDGMLMIDFVGQNGAKTSPQWRWMLE